MLTKPDLCSMALLKLGEQPIQSFQDDTASAKLARTLFDSVIDTLLLQHPWHFATTEIRLIKNSNNEFLIPANVLRVLKTDGRILGNSIQSDQDSILINSFHVILHLLLRRVWRWNFVCLCRATRHYLGRLFHCMKRNCKQPSSSTVLWRHRHT